MICVHSTMDTCRYSIQNVVHEDNEECGWEHATFRYTVSKALFPDLVLLVLYLSFPVFKPQLDESCVDWRSPERLWGWWVCSYLPWIALFLFSRLVSSRVRARHVHNLPKDLVQSSKYTDISYPRTKLQPTWDSCSYEHNATMSSAYKAPWIHAGIQFRTSFMKIFNSVGESTPPWGTPSLRISFLLWCCWFSTCPFLFSRFFTNHMSLALIRRSITFTTEVVETDGSVAICLGSHFSFFVDWYHHAWEHATYRIFSHSTKDLVQSCKYTDKTSTYKEQLF